MFLLAFQFLSPAVLQLAGLGRSDIPKLQRQVPDGILPLQPHQLRRALLPLPQEEEAETQCQAYGQCEVPPRHVAGSEGRRNQAANGEEEIDEDAQGFGLVGVGVLDQRFTPEVL